MGFYTEQNPPPDPPPSAWDGIFNALVGGMKPPSQMAAEARARGEKLNFITSEQRLVGRQAGE